MNSNSKTIGLVGHPVVQTPIALMMDAAFREMGLDLEYRELDTPGEKFEERLDSLRNFSLRGIHLTAPYKARALSYLDEMSPVVRMAGAVNTIIYKNAQLHGENTEGYGFLKTLTEDAEVNPREKQVTILGAGGTARAIAVELAQAGASVINIVNRTASRGKELAALINKHTSTTATSKPWTWVFKISPETEVLINTTPLGQHPDNSEPDLDYGTITDKMLVCDVVPNPPRTLFLEKAVTRGAFTLGGLGMLVHQGARAAELWTGHKAPVDAMKQALVDYFTARV